MSRYSSILKHADIFYQLTPTQLELIADLCVEKTYNAGEIIFLEGASCDELYVITRGEVDIQVNPSMVSAQAQDKNSPVTIATMRRGQSFGEIALVDEGFRSATAKVAQNNTEVLILPREQLIKLCDTYPQLGYLLMRNLAIDLSLKIRSTDLRIREEMLYGFHPKSNVGRD